MFTFVNTIIPGTERWTFSPSLTGILRMLWFRLCVLFGFKSIPYYKCEHNPPQYHGAQWSPPYKPGLYIGCVPCLLEEVNKDVANGITTSLFESKFTRELLHMDGQH
jgi:hypothetical protein